VKLFDNWKKFLVLGSNERSKAPEEGPFRCFDGHRLTIGRPSTIYQTVSVQVGIYEQICFCFQRTMGRCKASSELFARSVALKHRS